MELWESPGGYKVWAEFHRISDGVVELKKEDGSKLQVPLSRLTEASRKRAETLWEKEAAFAPEKFFEFQSYDFSLLKDGNVEWQPKFAGKSQGDPIVMVLNAGYNAKGKSWTGRGISQMSEPDITDHSIALEMVLEDGVKVSIQYELKPDTIQVGYQVIEPEGIEKGRYHIKVTMPAIFVTNTDTQLLEGFLLENPVAYDAIDPYLKDLFMKVSGEDENITFSFKDDPGGFRGRKKNVLVSGALGRNSKLKIDAGKNSYIGEWNYPGTSLWSGYHLFLEKNDFSEDAMGSANVFKLKLTY